LASFIIAPNQSNSSANPQYVCNMINAAGSGTAILNNCLTYDTNVVIPSGSVTVGETDWSAGAIYMCDPATSSNTSPGKVYQAMMGNDLPGSTNGSFPATATTGTPSNYCGFMYVLSLPGVQHSAHGGPNASSQGVIQQSGQDHRVYVDYNLVGAYHCVPWTSSPWGGYDFVPPYDDFFITDFQDDYASNAVPPYWGCTYVNGPSLDTVMFDLPRRNSANEEPILSLGFLRFANLTADDAYPFAGNQPGNAVGNSWFNVFESRLATVQSRPTYYFSANGTDSGPANTYDMSYLLNCALWDHYYFSSIPQAAAPLTINPANPRLVYAAGITPAVAQLGLGTSGVSGTDSTGLALPKEFAPSRYLMINGAFNINSTSIDAWKAVLAGLRKRSATVLDTTGATTTSSSFPRSLYQTQTYSQADTGTASTAYAGFRKLSDAQIATLATDLVQEIRLRGPFTGLADFINRSGVVGGTYSSLSATSLSPTQANTVQVAGALQTAIDRAGLNTANFVYNNPSGGGGGGNDVPTSTSNNNGSICMADQMPQTSSQSSATPGTCVTLNRAEGIPGWLTQADVLQALGPALAARSDTFVIRAYGDALDPVNTGGTVVAANILGRAWCEAVVQRFPDYGDPSNAAAVDPNGSTGSGTTITPANQRFGRKFRIVSFRWLTPNDI
jgi:hypothetical protein